jgi:hypothetical protein
MKNSDTDVRRGMGVASGSANNSSASHNTSYPIEKRRRKKARAPELMHTASAPESSSEAPRTDFVNDLFSFNFCVSCCRNQTHLFQPELTDPPPDLVTSVSYPVTTVNPDQQSNYVVGYSGAFLLSLGVDGFSFFFNVLRSRASHSFFSVDRLASNVSLRFRSAASRASSSCVGCTYDGDGGGVWWWWWWW